MRPCDLSWFLRLRDEVTVLDDKEVRRRFRASNYQSTTRSGHWEKCNFNYNPKVAVCNEEL